MHNTFLDDLTQIRTTLARTSEAASAAATILQGPGTYLLLAGNNAEMRSGSGAFEEAGTITTVNGNLHLSDMVPTYSLTLPVGTVPVGGDLEARWGWLLPGTDFRNLGLTPQFDVNGPLAASMWKASTGQSVDGVLAIDVGGLQDLLDVTGPVTTSSGQVVTASNVEQLLLHDQYVGETYTSDSSARTDELATLASATLHALENRPFKLHAMADALSSAAEGRHVLLWSADTRTEAAWSGAGVAGQLQPSSIMADIINRGGNKLDQYLTENVSLKLTAKGTGTAGTLTMTYTNKTPPGQSPFIAGPYPGLGLQYGEYLGIATVNLPAVLPRHHIAVEQLRRGEWSGGPHHFGGCQPRHPPGCDAEHHLQLRTARGTWLHDRRAERADRAGDLARRGCGGKVDVPGRPTQDHYLVAEPRNDLLGCRGHGTETETGGGQPKSALKAARLFGNDPPVISELTPPAL